MVPLGVIAGIEPATCVRTDVRTLLCQLSYITRERRSGGDELLGNVDQTAWREMPIFGRIAKSAWGR